MFWKYSLIRKRSIISADVCNALDRHPQIRSTLVVQAGPVAQHFQNAHRSALDHVPSDRSYRIAIQLQTHQMGESCQRVGQRIDRVVGQIETDERLELGDLIGQPFDFVVANVEDLQVRQLVTEIGGYFLKV